MEDNWDVTFPLEDGESMTIPVNYDSSGNWNCWFNNQPSSDTVGHQFGEMFAGWFNCVTLYGGGVDTQTGSFGLRT